MPSIRDMQDRMKSIESIGQLTRALQTVSASQVRKMTQYAENSRHYSELAWQVLNDLYHEDEFYNKTELFLQPDTIESAVVVFISADRGLAGSFPMNVYREAYRLEKRLKVPVEYITIGKKGADMLARRRKKIVADFSDLSATVDFHELRILSNIILEEYNRPGLISVYLVYTEFENIARCTPVTRLLVPFFEKYQDFVKTSPYARGTGCIYEGDPDVIMNSMVKRVIRMMLFHALTSSKASEHAARMLAMNKASENSDEILGQLQLDFNKVRQQMITNDLLDIIGGSEEQSKNKREMLAESGRFD